ncbi:unnamed protein product, partial [Timema podura]|nr:unnamed protein product [Timema podura]
VTHGLKQSWFMGVRRLATFFYKMSVSVRHEHCPISSARRGNMAIRPVYRPTIIKKRTKHFIRHQSDRYKKLKKKFTWICVVGEWKTILEKKNTLSTPERGSNLDLLVNGSLIYCEISTLDHAATKAGSC